MADAKHVTAGNSGLGGVADIITLLAGNKSTTTGTANTGSLEAILNRIGGNQDYGKLLEAVFAQAAGQIPKFQAAYSNAVGARSGNNSAVTAALNELMKATALEGQKQIVQQQQQSDKNQIDAASAIASATRGQTTRTPGMAKELLILQGLSKSGILDKLSKMELFGGATDTASGTLTSAADLFSAAAPNSIGDVTSGVSTLFDSSSAGDIAGGLFDLSSSLTDYGGGALDIGAAALDTASSAASSDFLDSLGGSIADFFSFKDGGLVGRDGVPNFADGGKVSVGAGGARKSSNPQISLSASPTSVAQNFSSQIARSSNRSASAPAVGSIGGSATNTIPADVGPVSNRDMAKNFGRVASMLTGPMGIAKTIASIAMEVIAKQEHSKLQDEFLQLEPNFFSSGISESVASSDPLAGLGDSIASGGMLGLGSPTGFGGGLDTGFSSEVGDMGSFGGGDVGGDAGGANDGMGGGDPNGGYKTGGEVKGPGTGTSDSIKARVSDGEYIMPAAVVEQLGVEFFDNIRAMFAGAKSAKE